MAVRLLPVPDLGSSSERRTVLAEESDHAAILRPDDILDRRRRQLGQDLLLLDIEENDRCRRRKQQAGCTAVEDIGRRRRAFDRLGDGVAEVSDLDRLSGLVENGEAVASDEDGGRTGTSLAL